MSQLHLRRPVACVVGAVPGFLDAFLADQRQGDKTVVTLRLPLGFPGLPTLEAERDCVIVVRRDDVSTTMVASYAVSWSADRGGPFPVFHGTLTIDNDEDYTSCFLDLRGNYSPPLGAAGELFDVVVGNAVANRVGADLLERIGTYLEEAYRASEAAKAVRRAGAVAPPA
jgi:hypothetical protein